jgi:hypothetical protein
MTASSLLSILSPLLAAKAEPAAGLFAAATEILPALTRGRSITNAEVSAAMTAAYGATDADGAWNWHTAGEMLELALAMACQRIDTTVTRLSENPEVVVQTLAKLQASVPTQTRRDDDQILLDQFSTPLPIACLAVLAAQIHPGDEVLEPSAGTGLLANLCAILGAKLTLNELDATRHAILSGLLKGAKLHQFDARHLSNLLADRFSTVIMNPPFKDIGRHVAAAYDTLNPGGRLVSVIPGYDTHRQAIRAVINKGQITADIGLPERSFAKTGTTAETRLLVIDKTDERPQWQSIRCTTLEEAIEVVSTLPARYRGSPAPAVTLTTADRIAISNGTQRRASFAARKGVPVTYLAIERPSAEAVSQIYATYRPSAIAITQAQPHPSDLVESSAMAAVTAPLPTAPLSLPEDVLRTGSLSDVQLEAVIYANDAHARPLPGRQKPDPKDPAALQPTTSDDPQGADYRTGYMIGDGTGVGKGRELAAVILAAQTSGEARHIWVSKNAALIEDARRDWVDLGGQPTDIQPLADWKNNQRIAFEAGILFVTYGAIRQEPTDTRRSRIEQIVEWANAKGPFNGGLVFDEAHEMANAAPPVPGANTRQSQQPKGSIQGRNGLILQNRLPGARVVYATATAGVEATNFGYANRLGLWGFHSSPFPTRDNFMSSITQGGVPALEILTRDLKALGLYCSRSLSFAGVEYDQLQYELTPTDIAIYDSWARAWAKVFSNLTAVMEATSITENGKVKDPAARTALLSAFYATQQRFFGHLLMSLQTPAMIADMEQELARNNSCIVQLVSTNEALLDRKLAGISPTDYDDLLIDVTPREYVMRYLASNWPLHVRETFEDANGAERTRIATNDSVPIISQTAARMRDALIEELSRLPEIKSGLDQVIQHFGPDKVAEITGRTKRLIDRNGHLTLERRATSAAVSETDDFNSGRKRILIFSQAGGTGRSYHASITVKNQQRRIHYLAEPGWRAQAAIQGFGRSHRTGQAVAPLYRVVTTNLKGQKRFTSTIASRLEALGAVTRGERRSGGQGLFHANDALTGPYTTQALSIYLSRVSQDEYPDLPYQDFQTVTGITLFDSEGNYTLNPPPLHRFLARLLALPVPTQNQIFDDFNQIREAILLDAREKGKLDTGWEDLQADSITQSDTITLSTHQQTGARTSAVLLKLTQAIKVPSAEALRREIGYADPKFVCNMRSGKYAAAIIGPMLIKDNAFCPTTILLRPGHRQRIATSEYEASHWHETTSSSAWNDGWNSQAADTPTTRSTTCAILTGLTIPIWGQLELEEAVIRRVRLDDGTTYLGQILDQAALNRLLDKLGASQVAYQPHDVLTQIEAGAIVQFANGMSIRRVRISGNTRFEIRSFPFRLDDQLIALGCFAEKIDWTRRIFIPIPQAASLVAKCMELSPVKAITGPSGSSEAA